MTATTTTSSSTASGGSTTTARTYWIAKSHDNNNQPLELDCLCIGTGRFLRAVLVPPMIATNTCRPALIQTRGTNFIDFMAQQHDASYPVDTVLYSGVMETVFVKCYGAFSLGTPAHKDALYQELIHGTTNSHVSMKR